VGVCPGSWTTCLGIFAALIPLGLFVSALVLGLSLLAGSTREARGYVDPALYLLLTLAGIGCLPSLQLDGGTAVIPVMNVVLAVRALFTGHLPPRLYGLVLASTLVAAGAMLALAARMFREEEVLLSGQRLWRPWARKRAA
jgi:ABC-type Na+ efflux pump permease subunit